MALGGVFVSLGDDPSALFANVSGLAAAASPSFYGELAESPGPLYGDESRAAAVYPFRRLAAGAGWYRRGIEEGGAENLIACGMAATLLTNAQGAFLSAGAAVKIGMISHGSSCECAGATERKTSFDLGIMFRPLPVISFAYVLSNGEDIAFGPSGEEEYWRRIQRWGLAYFWEERVTVGYEYERSGERTVHHYGFSVRTSTPIELLAGFSEDRLYGGARWVGGRFKLAVSFGPEEDRGIHTGVSAEIGLGLKTEE